MKTKEETQKQLTEKEKEILKYILSGFSDPGIAKIMWLSQATVRTHVHRIYKKYGIKKNKMYNQRVLIAKAEDDLLGSPANSRNWLTGCYGNEFCSRHIKSFFAVNNHFND